MRTSLYVTIRGEKITAEPIGVVEGKARFKAESAARPEGVTEIQRWTSDGGIVARRKFNDVKVVAGGPSFDQGNKELMERAAENRRRSLAGLPTVEEEQEAEARRRGRTQPAASPAKPAPAPSAPEPIKDTEPTQDAERKPKARKGH